jgi:hypothetical protein
MTLQVYVVVGDGSSGPDQNLQAIEFWNYALAIQKWCADKSVPATFYAPQRVGDEIVNNSQRKKAPQEDEPGKAPTGVKWFSSTNDVKTTIVSSVGLKMLVAVGHGIDTSGGGSVQLCRNQNRADMGISTEELNSIACCIYIGLHCFAANVVSKVTKQRPAFALTTNATGHNSDINAFVETCKEPFQTLIVYLKENPEPPTDRDEWEIFTTFVAGSLDALSKKVAPRMGGRTSSVVGKLATKPTNQW